METDRGIGRYVGIGFRIETPILANIWLKLYNWFMAREASTVTMNLSLPEPLKEYVDEKVSSGIYGSASEFVREAIREKLQREQDIQGGRSALATQLLRGLDSGKSIAFTDNHFQTKKSALIKRLSHKRK